jgi:rhodanese-related sulfurtransferase
MNKRYWMRGVASIALGLALAVPALAGETPDSLAGTKVINAEEAKKLHDAGVPMIDSRVAAEYAEKTIKGAISVPYKEKSEKVATFDATQDHFDLSKLPADKSAPLVVFCNGPECWKSYKASVAAVKAGYSKVYWFRGGFPEWSSKGLPTQ